MNPKKTERNQEAECIREYGVCTKTLSELKANGAFRAFSTQKRRAEKRGIGWMFSLKQWWDVWSESGKWELRGLGASAYCMSRHGDTGPYEPGNVSIKTNSENAIENIRGVIARHGRNLGNATFGRGRGWTYVPRVKNKPYRVQIRGLKDFTFATAKEAEDFYKSTTAAIKSGKAVIQNRKLVHGGTDVDFVSTSGHPLNG